MKKIVILICFLLLVVGCSDNSKKDEVVIKKITCDKMKELISNDAILIDVREQDEYNGGHLDNAINISYTTIKDIIGDYVTDKNKDIIVYCKSGKRSDKAANTLISSGYKNIYDLGSIDNCKNN